MSNAEIEIDGLEGPVALHINGSKPTFELQTDRIRAHLFRDLDPRHLDLLEIACAVFMADSTAKRGGATRDGMGRSWRRSFHISVAVRDPDFWRQDTVSGRLVKAVQFLTEDRFAFTFTQLDYPGPAQPYLSLSPDRPPFQADEVILFSGGLDSFAGALDMLTSTDKKVCLVTHRSAQKAIPRQQALGDYLCKRFPDRVLHIQVKARRKGGDEAKETTQRSRSFLFAALGHAVAHGFGARTINFFENGIISHNLPLTPQIVGTMATRTTHPQALQYLGDLLSSTGPEPIPLRNPFEWKTKTEVIQRIKETDALDQIVQTVSCTSIREQDKLHSHCGACSQCLDRRFAMLATGLAEEDKAEIYRTDVLEGPRENDTSITMAVEWTRHAISLSSLEFDDFHARFSLELIRIVRGFPNLNPEDCLRRIHSLHRRHGQAVHTALSGWIEEHSAQLADGSLPPTSLVRCYVGTGLTLPDVNTLGQEALAVDSGEIIPEYLGDRPIDPEAPLTVSFLRENGEFVVAVDGLGRISGAPAKAPFGLKPFFDEDCANGLSPDQHQFTQQLRLPGFEQPGAKGQLRTWVRRCRNELADNFLVIHGFKPEQPLLIQTKPSRGYRLDPTINIAVEI